MGALRLSINYISNPRKSWSELGNALTLTQPSMYNANVPPATVAHRKSCWSKSQKCTWRFKSNKIISTYKNTLLPIYSGYLNSQKLWKGTFNCWLFKWFAIQMVGNSNGWQFKWFAIQMPGTMHLNSKPVFKWWSEYRSAKQLVIWIQK